MSQHCKHCGTTRAERFYDSNSWVCKKCLYALQKQKRAENPKRAKAQTRAAYLRRKEQSMRETMRWRRDHLERHQQNQRDWKKRNIDECRRKAHDYLTIPIVKIRRRLHGSAKKMFGIPLGQTTEEQRRLLFYVRLFTLVSSEALTMVEAQRKIQEFAVHPLDVLISLYETTCHSSTLYGSNRNRGRPALTQI